MKTLDELKTQDLIDAAERVRAIYQDMHDKISKRHGIANPIVQELTRDIMAIDQLLAKNGDFFEYLGGQLVRPIE